MARKTAPSNCLHCNECFVADYRNRHHQKHCSKPACRQASRRESQRRWLGKPENRDYFRGPQNTARMQAWRKQNPGVGRRLRYKMTARGNPLPQSRLCLPESFLRYKISARLNPFFGWDLSPPSSTRRCKRTSWVTSAT